MSQLTGDDRRRAGEKIISVLEEADNPVSHEDLSREVDLDPDAAGTVVSDLVIGNQVSSNAELEYKLIE